MKAQLLVLTEAVTRVETMVYENQKACQTIPAAIAKDLSQSISSPKDKMQGAPAEGYTLTGGAAAPVKEFDPGSFSVAGPTDSDPAKAFPGKDNEVCDDDPLVDNAKVESDEERRKRKPKAKPKSVLKSLQHTELEQLKAIPPTGTHAYDDELLSREAETCKESKGRREWKFTGGHPDAVPQRQPTRATRARLHKAGLLSSLPDGVLGILSQAPDQHMPKKPNLLQQPGRPLSPQEPLQERPKISMKCEAEDPLCINEVVIQLLAYNPSRTLYETFAGKNQAAPGPPRGRPVPQYLYFTFQSDWVVVN
ncbi:hypothetical protein CBR_g9150 [Chara braunii]|uniref:Uncharacterized protein n=1 Tax=Chara braunii TaxID=69332 RepID=A0A388KNW0_CHABU|nr:hypothetical protein CBR_g9150 [Chara braunii]|eukprot:GBG71741.1 hypothetical protein CBR_g9150 [Chara braunii]